jgi:hypothetical protein
LNSVKKKIFFFGIVEGWVDNIKMDLREIGWDGMVWTGLNWLSIGTSSCEHGDEPSGSLKLLGIS